MFAGQVLSPAAKRNLEESRDEGGRTGGMCAGERGGNRGISGSHIRQVKERLKLENLIYLIISQNN